MAYCADLIIFSTSSEAVLFDYNQFYVEACTRVSECVRLCVCLRILIHSASHGASSSEKTFSSGLYVTIVLRLGDKLRKHTTDLCHELARALDLRLP